MALGVVGILGCRGDSVAMQSSRHRIAGMRAVLVQGSIAQRSAIRFYKADSTKARGKKG